MSRVTEMPADSNRPSLRHRLQEHDLDRIVLLALPALVFVSALFIYPSVYGIVLSFQPVDNSGFLGNYSEFFSDPYLRSTITNTFAIALPAALFNVVAALPLALMMRKQKRGQRTINTILVLPITLGTVLVAQGLLMYLGPKGWLNRALMFIGLTDGPIQFTHNHWAVIISLVVTGFPFAFLLMLSYASGINPALESAARTMGANGVQRFWKILLPLLSPGLAITFCLTFVLAFSVFPSASILGDPSGDSHVLSIAAANSAFQQYNFPMAMAISVITAFLELSVIGLVLALRSRFYSGSTAASKDDYVEHFSTEASNKGTRLA